MAAPNNLPLPPPPSYAPPPPPQSTDESTQSVSSSTQAAPPSSVETQRSSPSAPVSVEVPPTNAAADSAKLISDTVTPEIIVIPPRPERPAPLSKKAAAKEALPLQAQMSADKVENIAEKAVLRSGNSKEMPPELSNKIKDLADRAVQLNARKEALLARKEVLIAGAQEVKTKAANGTYSPEVAEGYAKRIVSAYQKNDEALAALAKKQAGQKEEYQALKAEVDAFKAAAKAEREASSPKSISERILNLEPMPSSDSRSRLMGMPETAPQEAEIRLEPIRDEPKPAAQPAMERISRQDSDASLQGSRRRFRHAEPGPAQEMLPAFLPLRKEGIKLADVVNQLKPDEKLRVENGELKVVKREWGLSFRTGTSEDSKAAVRPIIDELEMHADTMAPGSSLDPKAAKLLKACETNTWLKATINNDPKMKAAYEKILIKLAEIDPQAEALRQIEIASSGKNKLTPIKNENGDVIGVRATPRKESIFGKAGTSDEAHESVSYLLQLMENSLSEPTRILTAQSFINNVIGYLKNADPKKSTWATEVLKNDEALADKLGALESVNKASIGKMRVGEVAQTFQGMMQTLSRPDLAPGKYLDPKLEAELRTAVASTKDTITAIKTNIKPELLPEVTLLETAMKTRQESLNCLYHDELIKKALNDPEFFEAFINTFRWKTNAEQVFNSLISVVAKNSQDPELVQRAMNFAERFIQDPNIHRNNPQDLGHAERFLRSIDSLQLSGVDTVPLFDQLKVQRSKIPPAPPPAQPLAEGSAETMYASNKALVNEILTASGSDRENLVANMTYQISKSFVDSFKSLSLAELEQNAVLKLKQYDFKVSPNLVNLTEKSNRISTWIQVMVLSAETPADRAKILEFIIDVADNLRKQGNFHVAMQMVGGIRAAPVDRIITREPLSAAAAAKFAQLVSLTDPGTQFKNYRTAAQSLNGAYVPYLQQPMGLLTGTLDTNEDIRDANQVKLFNYNTFDPVNKILKVFTSAKEYDPPLPAAPEGARQVTADFEAMINSMPRKEPENLLYDRSLQLVPREPPKAEKEKERRNTVV